MGRLSHRRARRLRRAWKRRARRRTPFVSTRNRHRRERKGYFNRWGLTWLLASAIVLVLPMAPVPLPETVPTVMTDGRGDAPTDTTYHATGAREGPAFQTIATSPTTPPSEVTSSVGEPETVQSDEIPASPSEADGSVGPRVLILHSHTSESYETPHTLSRSGWDYHVPNTNDTGITRVGAAIAQGLEQRGIGVVHSTDVHNYPVHADAYSKSRATVKDVLARFPTIKMVLDVHRQGIPDMRWTTMINGVSAVKVELIYTVDQATPHALATAASGGSGEAGGHGEGRQHEGEVSSTKTMTDSADAGNGERSNRAFAHMFAEALNATYPGLLHKVTTVAGNRYNQDLFPNMLLLEVGNHLDMEADAITTGTLLADVIAQLLLELDD